MKSEFFNKAGWVLMAAALTLLFAVSISHAEHELDDKASLSWDANTEPDLSGYKVYMGTSSGDYSIPESVGNTTSYVATGLSAGTYFFAVTAIDTSGNESFFSDEVLKIVEIIPGDHTPPEPPTGLSIAQEIAAAGKHLMNALAMVLSKEEALRIE